MARKKSNDIFDREALNEKLTKDSKMHTNIVQEFVLTTEDKARICLNAHLETVSKRNSWQTPFGILLTIIITLITTDFRKFIVPKDTWTAIFIISGILSLYWTLHNAIKYGKTGSTVDSIIEELKKGSPAEGDIIISSTNLGGDKTQFGNYSIKHFSVKNDKDNGVNESEKEDAEKAGDQWIQQHIDISRGK